MKFTKLLTAAFALFLFCADVNAQTDPINIVTTAVPFLRISPDARTGGMGDVGIATSPDANSGFSNLAKIPFATSNTQAAVTYTPWLKDIASDVYLATLAGYHKLDDNQAIAVGVRYFNLGDIQFTDQNGNSIGNGRPREFGIDFGYTRKLSDKLSLGVALRYINSSLAKGDLGTGTIYKAGNAVAGDLSLYNNGLNAEGQGFTWGIVFSNLGSKIGYTNNAETKDFIPANAGIGAAYTSVIDQDNKITIAADVNHLLVPALPVLSDGSDSAGDANKLNDYRNTGVFESWFKSFSNNVYTAQLGLEYWYNDQFAARAGYYWETKEGGDRKYFTVGIGLKYNVFGFNFSYLVPSGNGVTRNPLSNTLRFSLMFDLDNATNGSATTTAAQ